MFWFPKETVREDVCAFPALFMEDEMSDLERAIILAMDAHYGQTDRGGQPYILHPLRVMFSMMGEEERIVAVLHDAVEDSDKVGLGDILALFGEDVRAAVDSVTRREGEDYFSYVGRAAMHPIGRKVKLADLMDNMDPSRSAGLTDSLRSRYNGALALLDLPAPRRQP